MTEKKNQWTCYRPTDIIQSEQLIEKFEREGINRVPLVLWDKNKVSTIHIITEKEEEEGRAENIFEGIAAGNGPYLVKHTNLKI